MGVLPKVLVVDDDPALLRALRRGLRTSFDIITAATVAEARALIEAERPDAILLDLKLRDESGLSLVRDHEHIVVHTGEPADPSLVGMRVVEKGSSMPELVAVLRSEITKT